MALERYILWHNVNTHKNTSNLASNFIAFIDDKFKIKAHFHLDIQYIHYHFGGIKIPLNLDFIWN